MEGLDLDIDPLALEEEWTRHPSAVGFWAERGIAASEELDRARAKFEEVKARLEVDIRENPAAFGITKVTESVIEAQTILQPEYSVANKAMLAARKEDSRCKAAMLCLEHKKRALSLLVELWIKDYYSDHRANKGQGPGPVDDGEKRALRARGKRRREERDKDVDD